MAHLGDDILNLVRELISSITHLAVDSDGFHQTEKYVVNKLKSADSMVFFNRKDLDAIVLSLSDKFLFHGFCSQADDLSKFYEKFLPTSLTKQETDCKMTIMKLLLCLSESPTNNFMNYSATFIPLVKEDVVDWPTYLKEGVERWSPPIDEASDSWSDDTKSVDSYSEDVGSIETKGKFIIIDHKQTCIRNVWEEYADVKKNLSVSVQQSWFEKDHSYLPTSSNVDANIAVYWDKYLQYKTKGLISLQKSKLISEYKAMREVLWQLWEPHTSVTYEFVGDNLLPRHNVSISSVRPGPFKEFMHEFLPYIQMLQNFRDFHSSITIATELDAVVPETFRSYDCALRNVIKPILDELLVLENEVMAQESHMSLIKLAHRVRIIFDNALILKNVHDNVVLNFKDNPPVLCSTTLLSRIHMGLLHCVTKNEQDIYLSLYLESLYKYFMIIHSWLSEDALIDLSAEFIIADENPKDPHVLCNGTSVNSSNNEKGDPDWQMKFVIRDLNDFSRADNVLKIIYTEVLQIGKNIHLLRLLGKLHLLKDTTNTDSLHEEFISRVLQQIAKYFKSTQCRASSGKESNDSLVSFKFPAICSDDCKYPTEMDKVENLVDTSDGFLMKAFASFFVENVKFEKSEDESLYQRISKLTKNLFPVEQIIDEAFLQILNERYVESGYMVKSLLIVDHKIEKHIELLKHVFLFQDDIIYLLYRRIFEQIEMNSWASDVWLTTQLHDIIMDIHPEFYGNCSVKVNENWRFGNDLLEACAMVKITYKVKWPINIIIRNEHMKMYLELFHTIIKIKWGLHTLNHLDFNEIESQKRTSKVFRELVARLQVLRFCLVNEFSSIQHYILGYVYNKSVKKFDDDFERAHNLDTLIASHHNFINDLHSTVIHFRDFNRSDYGFHLLLYLTRKLSFMWSNLKEIDQEELETCEMSYRRCHEYLNPIMYPRNSLDDYI